MKLSMTTAKMIAMQGYTNDLCISEAEFKQDYMAFSNVCRQLKRWKEGKDVNLRRLLNLLIILFNNFKYDTVIEILWFRGQENDILEELMSLLVVLDRMPKDVDKAVEPNKVLCYNLQKVLIHQKYHKD